MRSWTFFNLLELRGVYVASCPDEPPRPHPHRALGPCGDVSPLGTDRFHRGTSTHRPPRGNPTHETKRPVHDPQTRCRHRPARETGSRGPSEQRTLDVKGARGEPRPPVV